MDFFEMQILFGNKMNVKNLLIQKKKCAITHEFQESLSSFFEDNKNYNYNKKTDPLEFLIVVTMNKLYSILISLENTILLNDTWLTVYLYRYNYELYIKLKYIAKCRDSEEIVRRTSDFLTNGSKDNIRNKLNSIEDTDDELIAKLKEEHFDLYHAMNTIVHPNVESMTLHLNSSKVSHDDKFEFMKSTIHETHSMIFNIIKLLENISKNSKVNFSFFNEETEKVWRSKIKLD